MLHQLAAVGVAGSGLQFAIHNCKPIFFTIDLVSHLCGRALSEKFLEFLDVEASITSDASHSESIYWIVARNRHNANAVRHHGVIPLTHDAKASLLQSLNGIEVIDSGNLWHG